MIKFFKQLHKEESGQDLIEYALVALIVALGALAGMGQLASSINAEFTKISGSLTYDNDGSSACWKQAM